MEPEVTPVRPPAGAIALAVTAQIAAYAYLLTGVFAWWWQGKIAFASVAIYGLSRAIAAWGLLRLKRYGSILEQVSAIVWLLFCVGGWRQFGVIRPLLLPGVLVSIGELVYLNGASVRALFGGAGVPISRAAVVSWFGSTAVAALFAAIVIPNILTASGRSPQKHTMADMRTIATAWEARATDVNRYNAAAIDFPTTGVTFENLTTYLTPTYVKYLPAKDAWGNNYHFGADRPWGAKEAAQVYTVISYGKDGKSQGKWEGGATTHFDCDIIYSNGTFLQYPEGVQQQ
ncbi:MAG: hypothetical protein DMF59_17085 [Acidobacteria bacterium]|nr:MAG: hypothetical protein DMF59_17085 [Acidobacteriota bacterium]